MYKKKILIFGATGSTGIYLTDYLLKHINSDNYEIVAIGRRKTNYFEKFRIKYYSVDVTKKEELSKIDIANAYAAVILTGVLPARMKGYSPEDYIDVNIKGVLNIMEYIKNSGINRVIYTISISDLHGHLPDNKEFMPDMQIKYKYGTDHTIYAISKTAATEIIKTYFYEYGINYYILRLPNIYMYSPEKEYYVDGEPRKISYRYMIDRAIQGLDIELWGNPQQKRDIVYVKDFCQFVFKTLFTSCESGYFNVGADFMISMQKQIEGIIKVFSRKDNPSRIILCPDKPSCDNAHMNIDKARELLGYEPEYDYISYLEDYKKEMNSDRFRGL